LFVRLDVNQSFIIFLFKNVVHYLNFVKTGFQKKLHGISTELSIIENEIESRKDLLKRVTAEKEDVLQV